MTREVRNDGRTEQDGDEPSTLSHGLLAKVLAFLVEHGGATDADLARLQAERPDITARPAVITQHAGEVGVVVGQRELLERLGDLVAGHIEVVTQPGPPSAEAHPPQE